MQMLRKEGDLAKEAKLPVINNPESLSFSELEQLLQVGFCFVKLPDDKDYVTSYNKIYENGLCFFRQPRAEKDKYAFDSGRLAGYLDRRDGRVPLRMEQFICRPEDPFGPLAHLENNIADIIGIYRDHIAIPIIKQILKKLGLINYYETVLDDSFSSLAFPYYPPDLEARFLDEVSPHKDFELITVLAINKPGLQVFYQDQWINILPKNGFVVVNIANTLEKITSNLCKSAMHRVLLPEKNNERMSFGLFFGQGLHKPVVDLVTGKTLYSSTAEFLQMQLQQYHFDELKSDKASI